MATGVFDLLHPGHLYFLREARKLGDELWVVVARDSTARRFKHEPIMSEGSRVALVESLKPVDRAVLGHEGNIYEILDEIRPDVIALGFDQVHD
jgi:FAD synthetase